MTMYRPDPLPWGEAIFEPRADGSLRVRNATRLDAFPGRSTERLEHWAVAAPERVLLASRDGDYRKVGGGASVFIARLIGSWRMTDMMLTGRVMDAAAAERTGLVQYLVSTGDAKSKAVELAAKMSAMAPLTILGTLPRIQDMSAAD